MLEATKDAEQEELIASPLCGIIFVECAVTWQYVDGPGWVGATMVRSTSSLGGET